MKYIQILRNGGRRDKKFNLKIKSMMRVKTSIKTIIIFKIVPFNKCIQLGNDIFSYLFFFSVLIIKTTNCINQRGQFKLF